MRTHQTTRVEGTVLVVSRSARLDEMHQFGSAEEAQRRQKFVDEALTWVGTPFRDCADVKGPNGAVDCAMLLTRSAVDSGLLPAFDPRPYSPRAMLHSTEERSEKSFLKILASMGAREVEVPRVGDVLVYLFGRMFSHGAVLVNGDEVCHAYAAAGMCLVSRRDEDLLRMIDKGLRRPVRCFDLWGDC